MKYFQYLFFIVCFSFQAQAQLSAMTVQEAQNLVNQTMPEAIVTSLAQTPSEYSFFNANQESTVNYQGQVMRQVLINDSKLAFSSMRYGSLKGKFDSAYDRMNAFFQYNVGVNGETPFQISALDENGGKAFIWEGFLYASIFPRAINLEDKFAGNDNGLRHGKLLGWNSTNLEGVLVDSNQDGIVYPAELYQTLMKVIANNAAGEKTHFMAPNGNLPAQKVEGAHILSSGVDLAQMAQKILHGAVSFSQAAGDYTSVDLPLEKQKGLLADNEQPYKEFPYTALQHHWDEAFGYFGAARNYLEYTDLQIRNGYSLDRYESTDYIDAQSGDILYVQQNYNRPDGQISISGEINLGMSQNAAKRDLGAKLGNEDFTGKTMEAFLKGRQLVQDRPAGYLQYAQAYAVLAVHEWERVLAATVVHYINETVSDLQAYGTEKYKFSNLAKHFGEMKGFALAFQFNPNSVLFNADGSTKNTKSFLKIHQLIGDRPADPTSDQVSAYIDGLLEVRSILEQTYGFDPANVKEW